MCLCCGELFTQFIGMIIIDPNIVRTVSIFPKSCNRPLRFPDALHTAWLISETALLPSQNTLVGALCVPQGLEDFSAGNSVVSPILEMTAQVCWQCPNYPPRMLKEGK